MKDIKDYEGLYAVTSCGRVWSYKSEKFLKLVKGNHGYYYVNLCKMGKAKPYLVHRLVAEAYIPNLEKKPQVNHKSEIRTENWVSNLEWVTNKENINFGSHTKKQSQSRSKAVFCIELNKVFESGKQAAKELGLRQGNIWHCCMGERNRCGGYHFKFYKEQV